MATRFDPPPTAEHVVSAVDAVFVSQQPASIEFVADFSDMTQDQAESALLLAEDMGFINDTGQFLYAATSPLCRYVASPNQMQKAAVLRVLLESYSPFIMFRQRLSITGSVADAARETRIALGMTEHRDKISATLISLGTYSQALTTAGAGRYEVNDASPENALERLMEACSDEAVSEDRIRKQIGTDALNIVSRDQVILPLANALRRANARDARGAVTEAGNAIESHLTELAQRQAINLAGKHGINAKAEEIRRANQRFMPSKLLKVGNYLGFVRNAADHGIDPDIDSQWDIRESTGTEYVFVACTFVAASIGIELGKPPEI